MCVVFKKQKLTKGVDINISNNREFKTAIIRKLTFSQSGSQWEIYEKSTKIRRRNGVVTRVFHT